VIEVMKKMPDGSVDLIVTSPPYNLKNSTGNGMKDGRGGKWANAALQKGYSHYNDNMPHKDYVKWHSQHFFISSLRLEQSGLFRKFYCHFSWAHQEGGKKYPKGEMSFRQTIHGNACSDRGFKVIIDRKEKKILVSFNLKCVDKKHKAWLKNVKKRVGLNELNPQPCWGFDDLEYKAGTKLPNTFYVQAEVEIRRKKEFYHYTKVVMLQKFSFEGFLKALEEGKILVDFDARTGHNHGTKFRMKQDCLPMLYQKSTIII